MMEISIFSSKYQKQVKELVISIHEEFGFPYNFKLDYDLENPAKYYLETGGVFYVLLDEEKVVGTAAVKKINKNRAELKRMYLLKEYRGQGWGRKLLEKVITFAKDSNFKKIQLDTNIKQVEAHGLYKKLGFEVYKKEKNDIFMSLKLE